MRYVQTMVLRYAELDDKAKETAKEWHQHYGYMHADEAMETLDELVERFGSEIIDYQIDWSCRGQSRAEFGAPDEYYDDGSDTEASLKAMIESLGSYNPETLKGLGDCVLTGVCWDEDAIDGLRKAYHDGERYVPTLLEAAFESLVKATEAEYEAFYGPDDADFAEHCDANGYEFLADGSRYTGP